MLDPKLALSRVECVLRREMALRRRNGCATQTSDFILTLHRAILVEALHDGFGVDRESSGRGLSFVIADKCRSPVGAYLRDYAIGAFGLIDLELARPEVLRVWGAVVPERASRLAPSENRGFLFRACQFP